MSFRFLELLGYKRLMRNVRHDAALEVPGKPKDLSRFAVLKCEKLKIDSPTST